VGARPPATGPAVGGPAGYAPVTIAAGPHSVELAGLLHELTARVLGAENEPEALARLADLAGIAVPTAMRCSVALIGERTPLARATSSPRGQGVDNLQYELGRGPGLDAARTRSLIIAPDLAADPRWPELADCAKAEGVHAVVAIPLDVRRVSVGSLSLFLPGPAGICPEELLSAMAIVNQAEMLLGELRRRELLSEGAAVDRAVGVLIAQRGCGVRDAYDLLQETSYRLGLDRRAVAERLIGAAARNAGT
jgi:ANTAR domain-containing protein/GAF domain-containing protein